MEGENAPKNYFVWGCFPKSLIAESRDREICSWIHWLTSCMTGPPPAARVAASIAILDRGYGRPHQSIEVLRDQSITVSYPSQEAINEELKRRGLMPVLELVATHIEDERAASLLLPRPAGYPFK